MPLPGATWNSLSDELRNLDLCSATFRRNFKDVSVSAIPGALSALEALCDYALYKSTFALHYITSCLAPNKIHNGGILVVAYQSSLGKWPLNCVVVVCLLGRRSKLGRTM